MEKIKIAVIGLGYVGLPLARLFSTKYETVGFDMNQARVDALNGGMMLRLKLTTSCCEQLLQVDSPVRPTSMRYATATSM